jgi:hypothetical protein
LKSQPVLDPLPNQCSWHFRMIQSQSLLIAATARSECGIAQMKGLEIAFNHGIERIGDERSLSRRHIGDGGV